MPVTSPNLRCGTKRQKYLTLKATLFSIPEFDNALQSYLGQEDLKVIGAEGGGAQLRLVEDEGDDNADNWKIMATGNYFYIQNQ